MKRNPTLQGNFGPSMNAFRSLSVKTSKNLNASVARMGTGTRMRTRTWTTEVSRIALCTLCSRPKNKKSFGSVFHFSGKQLYIKKTLMWWFTNIRDFLLKFHYLPRN